MGKRDDEKMNEGEDLGNKGQKDGGEGLGEKDEGRRMRGEG